MESGEGLLKQLVGKQNLEGDYPYWLFSASKMFLPR